MDSLKEHYQNLERQVAALEIQTQKNRLQELYALLIILHDIRDLKLNISRHVVQKMICVLIDNFNIAPKKLTDPFNSSVSMISCWKVGRNAPPREKKEIILNYTIEEIEKHAKKMEKKLIFVQE